MIGDTNRLAHAAALTVAEMPAQTYNPLFICGPPGVGKTHLLGSIARLAATHNPGLTVRSTTGEAFTSQFLSALNDGGLASFKSSYRHIDILLIDDVQFLQRKARTEEEFFHTFNALYGTGSQIVLTSDRPPADLQDLEDRLRARFASGLVADIHLPDEATRLAILRKRADHDHLPLQGDGVLETLAQRVPLDVRALEGVLIRAVAFSSLTGRPLTRELANEVVDGSTPALPQRPCRSPTSRPPPACTSASPPRSSCQPPAPHGCYGRARSLCTSPVSSPANPSRRSPASSGAAITLLSYMPVSGPRNGYTTTPSSAQPSTP